MPARRIAVIVGSLRKDSFTRRVAHALQQLQPASLHLEIVEIRDLPLYDQDGEEHPPAPWVAFRDAVRGCDGVIFLTPEYNRSIPGALKNAIDVGSRPYGKSVWSGKPCGVVSTSPGAIGGFGANHHLRQCLVFLDMPIVQQPEMYVGGVDKLVEPGGKVTSDATRELFAKFLATFANVLERNARKG
ncbi:MAG: NADPH-dependent FMN reductase [Usitatibacter sp.]